MERLERTKEAGTREPGKSFWESPAGRVSGAPFSPQPGNGSLEAAHYRQNCGPRKGEGGVPCFPARCLCPHPPVMARLDRAIHGNPPQRPRMPPVDAPAKPGHDGFGEGRKAPTPRQPQLRHARARPGHPCSARGRRKNLPLPLEAAIFVPYLFNLFSGGRSCGQNPGAGQPPGRGRVL